MAARSRSEMEAILSRGASIMLDHRQGTVSVVSTAAELPSAASLARSSGDAAKVAEARELLAQRKRALELEMAELDQHDRAEAAKKVEAQHGSKADADDAGGAKAEPKKAEPVKFETPKGK